MVKRYYPDSYCDETWMEEGDKTNEGDWIAYKDYKHLEQRIAELEAQIPRWIPMSERFPEIGPAVLVLHESGWICTTGWIVLGQKINEPNPQYGKKDRPTHWMLIPKAPGVGDE